MNLSKPQRRILQRLIRDEIEDKESWGPKPTKAEEATLAQLRLILKELKRHLSDRATNPRGKKPSDRRRLSVKQIDNMTIPPLVDRL